MGRPKKNGPPAGFSAIKPLERSQFDLEEGENTICVYEARRKGTSQKTGRPYDTIDIRIEGEANFMFVRSMLAGLLDNCDPPLEGGETLQAAVLLAAVGRAPNVEGIGLETIGIELSDGVISVDERCRTAVEGVYAE